jgi:YegS/Rv2252/BmrU family lipid kinase
VRKKRILFIVNPNSGLFTKHRVPRSVEKYLDHDQFDYEIRYTERGGHATELAQWAVKECFDIVVAAGGDGSVNEVARGLIGTNVALGIIPLGSGNGLANNLGIKPHKVNVALRNFNRDYRVKIDVAQTDFGLFISNLGIGFDAHVAHRFSKYKVRGFFSYAKAIFKEFFFAYTAQPITISLDNQELKREVFVCSVFNSNQYGYHIGPFGRISLMDGYLDVLVINKFPKWQVLWYTTGIMLRRIDKLKRVERFRVKELTIFHDNGVLQFDGEPLEWPQKVSISINHLSLNIVVPQKIK